MMSLPRIVFLSGLALALWGTPDQEASAASWATSAALGFSAAQSPQSGNMVLAAQDTVPSAHGHTIDLSNKGIVSVLRDIFIRAGTIDGKRINDLKLITRCKTAFVTDGGAVEIDWSKVGNYAGNYGGGRETFPIDDGSGTHNISVPAGKHPEPLGNAGARTDGGFSSLADSCQQRLG